MKNIKLLLILFCTLFFITGCIKVKREYHKNGHLSSETHYRFGKETGITTYYHSWYPTKIMEVEMKRGKRNGKLIKRYFDNKIELTATYKNDLLNGEETYYYKNGKKKKKTHYVKGMKHGKVTSWYFDGMVKESGNFVNDLFDGEWENFDERGLLIGEGSFVQGTGKRTVFDYLGHLQCETHFVNNKKEGIETHYFPSGEIDKTILFKEDRIVEINGVPVENL
jgi:antitoxin component YwqK of YwqJK toxin-antitoxin module